jgi:hypothetical protein
LRSAGREVSPIQHLVAVLQQLVANGALGIAGDREQPGSAQQFDRLPVPGFYVLSGRRGGLAAD